MYAQQSVSDANEHLLTKDFRKKDSEMQLGEIGIDRRQRKARGKFDTPFDSQINSPFDNTSPLRTDSNAILVKKSPQ